MSTQEECAAGIGRSLMEARQRLKLEVTAVATALHLRKHYITAMESGAFEDLPGGVYARGYLKRYSDFLELDTDYLLAEFDQTGHIQPRRFFVISESLDHSPHPSRRLVMMTLIAAFLLVLSWNLLTPRPSVSPILSFETYGQLPEIAAVPYRCQGRRDAYPPCYWEDRGLWYRAVKGGW